MAYINTYIDAYNPDIIGSKSMYIHSMVRKVRDTGDDEFWVLNKMYLEIYSFKVVQVTDFDIQIDLRNCLENELVYSGIFVIHMKDHILELLEEVPGKIYLKKLDCYRSLYASLNEKVGHTKSSKIKQELLEKIEFIETEFPQFII